MCARAHLLVTYKPAGPTQAALTVTAHTSHGTATRTTTVTIQPAARHPLPLALTAPRQDILGGQMLVVRVRTAPRAHVTMALQVAAAKVTISGDGKSRKRTVCTVVLYRTNGQGVADAHGQFNGRLRVTYRPVKPAPATLTVTTGMGNATTTRTMKVTIQPPKR